jgi:hypothetical protein
MRNLLQLHPLFSLTVSNLAKLSEYPLQGEDWVEHR